MPTLRRRLLNLLEVVSLLLCAAAILVWVRSFYRWDLVEYVRDGWTLSVMAGSGVADVISSAELPEVTGDWTTEPAPPGARVRWGLRFDFADYPAWLVRVPLWFPAALAGVLPAARAWRRVRRRRRRGPGHCARCGYNLTGNVSGVCPECGRTLG
jgi:hypothetical protein